LELAEGLLDAARSILPHVDRLAEPLEHYTGSLNQATASILDVLSGVFAQLSLRSEGGVTVDLFYAQCEPFSVGYLKQYLEACQTLVKQHRSDLRSRFPYDAMAVRAQTLKCLLIDAFSVSRQKV
jgi:hypothetical protein